MSSAISSTSSSGRGRRSRLLLSNGLAEGIEGGGGDGEGVLEGVGLELEAVLGRGAGRARVGGGVVGVGAGLAGLGDIVMVATADVGVRV